MTELITEVAKELDISTWQGYELYDTKDKITPWWVVRDAFAKKFSYRYVFDPCALSS